MAIFRFKKASRFPAIPGTERRFGTSFIDMSFRGTRPRFVLLTVSVLLASAMFPAGQLARATDAAGDELDRALVQRWRQRQAEIRALQAKFVGSIEGADLEQLGAVGFVLEQARSVPRRFLDPEDHNLVFSAVEGQNLRELEMNLPAMANYIKLSMSASALLPAARGRKPLIGRRKGIDTLVEIARGVHDFRLEQLRKVRSGEIRPDQVLTKQNLGAFGGRDMLARLERAYNEGHRQYSGQRNMVVLGVLAIQLQFGFVVALWIRRRAEGFVVVRGRA